jgi:hypothetical protein
MSAYATVVDLREYLDQVRDTEATDAALETVLERATAMVDGVLGFHFSAYGETATERDVWSGAGGEFLYLPAHEAGSLTGITLVSGRGTDWEAETEITDYVVEERWRLYRYAGWTRRRWYRATAVWGLGDPPAEVVEVTLQVAVNLWQGRDAGRWSENVGEGAVQYQRALGWPQRNTLAPVRNKYRRAL